MRISSATLRTVSLILTAASTVCLLLARWDDIADGFVCLVGAIRRKIKVLQSAPRCRTCEDAEDWEK